MDRSKIRPLEPLALRTRPLAPHALAWSCDAELAVATDNAIYVFLPEYPKAGETHAADMLNPQFSVPLQALGILKPDPAINAQLCAAAGLRLSSHRLDDDDSISGVGSGSITSAGAALGQPVRVEWSPSGVGQNLRPVLSVLTTSGCIITLGEHIDTRSTVVAGRRARSFKTWKMLWGLGGHLPIPDAACEDGIRKMDERIVSFSWAKHVAHGRSILAYKTDAGSVVIMAVQFFQAGPSAEDDFIWKVSEVARFDGEGPHRMDPADPAHVPCETAFALKWSPWLVKDGMRTATLAYLAPHYVGFRRVSMSVRWDQNQTPAVQLERYNTTSLCLPLRPDAFVEWEEAVMDHDGTPVARGVIGTPFEVKAFQVAFTGSTTVDSISVHSTETCSAAFQGAEAGTNPIAGFILHHPDKGNVPPAPFYSLVRLSATWTNQDWYQTNVSEESWYIPQWAETVKKDCDRLISRAAALGSSGLDSDSDEDDAQDDDMGASQRTSALLVHPVRYRFGGMAASPGGGCTAVLVSKYGTQHPQRRPISKILFGWPSKLEGAGEPAERPALNVKLTTEGRMWESIYGYGGEAPGVTATASGVDPNLGHRPLESRFQDVITKQRCVFCDTQLRMLEGETVCENSHVFATCAASGLAIMAPGVSRICGVCGLRCLTVAALAETARRLIGPEARVESSGESCGVCGGKFIT